MSLTVPDKLNSRLSLNGAILFGGTGTITRQLPYFAGSQYATLNWTAAGNGSIEIPYSTTVTGSAYDLVNGIGVTAGDVFTTPATVTDILVDGSSVGLGGAAPNDGKVHTVKFVFDSGITLTHLGQNGASGNFFTGHIFSLTLTDLDTPSNSVAYGLNSGSTTTESPTVGTGDLTYQNFVAADWGNYTYQTNITHDAGTIAAAWVGTELVTNGGFDTDTDWTKMTGITIADGHAVFTSVASGLEIYQVPAGFPSTGSFSVSFDVSDYSAGGAYVRHPFNAWNQVAGANGSFTYINPMNSSAWVSIRSSGTTTLKVDNVSVKQILELA